MAITKKRGRGRPEFVPTDRQRGMVAGMALWNISMEQIRQRIFKPDGKILNERTFKKVFKEELQESYTNVETNLATALYKRGLKGSDYAATFILRCKFGWKEQDIDLDGTWEIEGGLPPFLESELSPDEAATEEGSAEEVPAETTANNA